MACRASELARIFDDVASRLSAMTRAYAILVDGVSLEVAKKRGVVPPRIDEVTSLLDSMSRAVGVVAAVYNSDERRYYITGNWGSFILTVDAGTGVVDGGRDCATIAIDVIKKVYAADKLAAVISKLEEVAELEVKELTPVFEEAGKLELARPDESISWIEFFVDEEE